MAMATIDYREHDRQIWEEGLDEFVPDRVFDAHYHLFQKADFTELSTFAQGRKDADVATLREWASVLYPGREFNILLLGTPLVGIDIDAHVRTVVKELTDEPNIRHFRVVTPKCELSNIHEQLLSMKHAAEIAGLTQGQIEGIFWDNATTALGLSADR